MAEKVNIIIPAIRLDSELLKCLEEINKIRYSNFDVTIVLDQNGKVKLANKLLGRTWQIEGIVNKGKKIGRKLGYRTCNIDIKNYVLPKIGIYAVKILIGKAKKIHGGVAYIGSRPTFNGKNIFLEINIFGINKNLYKKKLSVYFLKFLRKDKKFVNSKELIKQMNKDVIFAKKGLKKNLVI